MKKKVLGLALVAMSLVSFSSMAQNKSNDTTTKQETVKGKKTDKQNRRTQINPFDGLSLTETQKSQLQQLDANRKTARKQQAQTRRENKQRNDSARMAQRQATKKAYLDEVKAIIGPEQYVVFLENMYVNSGGHRHGKSAVSQSKNGNDKANRKGRGDSKGNRGHHHAFNRSAKSNSTPAVSNS